MAASWLRAWLGALLTLWDFWGLVAPHQNVSNGSVVTTDSEVVSQEPLWAWHPSSYPDPRIQPEACGRPSPSAVCDPDGWLSKQEAERLDALIQLICNGFGCPCSEATCSQICPGYSVSIAVVTTRQQSYDNNNEDLRRESQLFVDNLRTQRWRHGACANDIVILLTLPSKNELYLSVGERAVSHVIPVCDDAIRYDARRNFRHNFPLARVLEQAVKDVRAVLRGRFKCVLHHGDVLPTGTAIAIIFASVCVPLMACVLLVFLGPCFRGRGFGGKKHKADNCKKYRYHSPGFATVEETMAA